MLVNVGAWVKIDNVVFGELLNRIKLIFLWGYNIEFLLQYIKVFDRNIG